MATPVKVLIVDDEEHILKALRRLLRGQADIEVYTTTDPLQALEIVKKEEVDIVISDHLMPKMSGIELLEKVRQIRPDTIRIVLTGHAQLQMAIDAINKGQVYKFLTKPWDDTALLQDIRMAARVVRLERENLRLRAQVEQQARILEELERRHPGITNVKRDEQGRIILEDE